MSQFILNAKELEIDGVAQNGKIIIYAISDILKMPAYTVAMLLSYTLLNDCIWRLSAELKLLPDKS